MSFIATILLIPILLIQIITIFNNKEEKVTKYFILLSGTLLFIELVYRSIIIGFPALTNTFEALIFFSASILIIVGIYSFFNDISKNINFGATIVALLLLLVSSSPLASNVISPPIPALQSNWLLLHVSFSFIGQSFFVLSFIAAILALANPQKEIIYKRIVINSIIIGYPIYSAGAIIFGSIWASYAWGSFWSWDPKEIWALVTWFVYTIILHGRNSSFFKSKVILWLSILGFFVSLFTFLGVNFLLPSLHSYR